ncbi:MAG: HD-GYP domain-containing protein [Coriobacteriia bacterium]
MSAAALAASVVAAPVGFSRVLLLLLAATVVAENLAVDIPGGGSASIAYPLTLAAIMLLGPAAGGLVAAFSGMNINDVRRRRPFEHIGFNIAQLVLSAVAAGWAYRLSFSVLNNGHLIQFPVTTLSTGSATAAVLGAVLALGLVSVILNVGLVGAAISLLNQIPVRRVWATNASWIAPTQLALALLGLAIAQVLGTVGPVGFLLFVVPLIVARQVYVRYVALREAYVDTTRSLVAAIEAKDPYTRGHSERVAAYSQQIARAMHLDEKSVSKLEWAGLLHDLGKIGISNRTLQKPSTLTRDEFDEIKRHPGIGAHILESVTFLHDVVPAVAAHHERLDGSGYSLGLTGDDIPLEARILAVADSYDAMTSQRPYRDALSPEMALGELELNTGKHFDEQVVAAFAGLDVAHEDAEMLVGPAVGDA